MINIVVGDDTKSIWDFQYEHTYATIVVGSKLSEERSQPISVPQTPTISSHALTWRVHDACCDFDS